MSASRSEPAESSQHDLALDALEAALPKLTRAKGQAAPECGQSQLAVEAPDRKLEADEPMDQLSCRGGACSKWHSKKGLKGLGDVKKGPTDDIISKPSFIMN